MPNPLTFPPGGVVDGTPWGYGKGGAVIRPPNVTQSGLPAMGRMLILPLPEDSPIPDAHEFNVEGAVATAAVTANPVAITGCSYTVPAGSLGVVRNVSVYINNMLATTDVRWFVYIDGSPVAGYAPITVFSRVAAFVGTSFDAKIRITGPATVSISFMNVDGGAYSVGAALGGWDWPQASDDRWKAYGM
jgi:hypothetical protein